MPVGDSAVSPPASVTLNCVANARSPCVRRRTQACENPRGTAKERKAAIGVPPIAAISLNPRVRQRCPTTSGECHSWRKWIPSSVKSVVTRISCPAGTRNTAQSSPMPVVTPERRVAACRMREISVFSVTGTTGPLYREHPSGEKARSGRPCYGCRSGFRGVLAHVLAPIG